MCGGYTPTPPIGGGGYGGGGDISPSGEVLSMDGKYPKILGPAGPNPGRTFRPCPKFVRRGRELGAVPSSARCRSCQSNQVPLFFHIAPLVCLAFPALFGRGRPMWRPGSVGRDDPARRVVTITPPHPSSPSAMPPSPLGGEGLTGGQRPPLRGRIDSIHIPHKKQGGRTLPPCVFAIFKFRTPRCPRYGGAAPRRGCC